VFAAGTRFDQGMGGYSRTLAYESEGDYGVYPLKEAANGGGEFPLQLLWDVIETPLLSHGQWLTTRASDRRDNDIAPRPGGMDRIDGAKEQQNDQKQARIQVLRGSQSALYQTVVWLHDEHGHFLSVEQRISMLGIVIVKIAGTKRD
jgi:hypothetical protein